MSTIPNTTTNVNISMPAKIHAAMRERMADQGFENASEYVRYLIREDSKKTTPLNIEAAALEGEASGDPIPIDDEWWERKKAKLREELEKRKARG